MNLQGIVRVVRGLVKSKIIDNTSGLGANVDTKPNGRNGLQVIDGPEPNDFIYADSVILTNGSNRNMAVDADPTAQTFSYTVPGGETWYMDSIGMLILDPGTMDVEDYGAIGGGLPPSQTTLVEFVLNGTTYTFANLSDNLDLTATFPETGYIATNARWLDEDDMYIGIRRFDKPITLRAGDIVRAVIRDDIDAVEYHSMWITKWRTIS